jgi:hypothetical protein
MAANAENRKPQAAFRLRGGCGDRRVDGLRGGLKGPTTKVYQYPQVPLCFTCGD